MGTTGARRVTLALFLCLAGAAVSGLLLLQHHGEGRAVSAVKQVCGEGEAGKLIDERETWHGGRIPVNVSGGLLSKGHPLGATGVANIYEVSTHLRGEAGDRQVAGAKVGLTHVIGLGSACAIHILEKTA